MLLARVVGTLVASRKEPSLEGLKLLVLRQLDVDGKEAAGYRVAVDAVGAGPGEVVLVLTPRIVRGPGFTESDLLALCVGTETQIELCGRGAPASVARR